MCAWFWHQCERPSSFSHVDPLHRGICDKRGRPGWVCGAVLTDGPLHFISMTSLWDGLLDICVRKDPSGRCLEQRPSTCPSAASISGRRVWGVQPAIPKNVTTPPPAQGCGQAKQDVTCLVSLTHPPVKPLPSHCQCLWLKLLSVEHESE